jgi:hypothetical protein
VAEFLVRSLRAHTGGWGLAQQGATAAVQTTEGTRGPDAQLGDTADRLRQQSAVGDGSRPHPRALSAAWLAAIEGAPGSTRRLRGLAGHKSPAMHLAWPRNVIAKLPERQDLH